MLYFLCFLMGVAHGCYATLIGLLFLKACLSIAFLREPIEATLLDDSLILSILDHKKYKQSSSSFLKSNHTLITTIDEFPTYVDASEIIAQIIAQTICLIFDSRPKDKEYQEVRSIDLNQMFLAAENYFVQFTDKPKNYVRLIDSKACQLEKKIELFLDNYPCLDQYALIQNLKNELKAQDLLYEMEEQKDS